jgi:hypothetical protein
MSVRAKFLVESIQQWRNGGTTLVLSPVVGGSAENEQFFKWTPNGKIELLTVNEAAAAQFKLGQSYYIDFTEAD